MARNAEKAMTALARFRQAQLEEGKVKERRPFLASECTELPKAEKWRRQIIGEISKKVAQIQNAGLGEFRIRDLNDEINKLLREKGHWEVRIKELGGPDYGSDEEGGPDRGGEDGQQKFIAHVPVPSQQEVGRWARWALLWVPPVPAGSSDSRGAGDHVQFRVWVQGRRESIHLRAVACPAVHGGSLWLTCAWEEVSGEVDAAPAPPLLPADRGGARAQEEDGAATEVHQRDPAGPERGGPAAPGLLGGPAAASPALLAHTMRPPGWAAGPLASPQPREPTRMCPEWEGQAGPAACKCRQWWGGQPGTPLSAQMCP
uniref:Pre-mRNA-splicing factor ISY1 homolog n=1 Tax=Bos mutus grunniens TaxID=30521 RepID=A0A8B9XH99_BOSMU